MLAEVNASAEIERFQAAVSQYTDDESAANFERLRNLICKTILALTRSVSNKVGGLWAGARGGNSDANGRGLQPDAA